MVNPLRFDPEGEGYDYDTAIASGDKPNQEGHWSSLDPRSGMVLKGRKHKTWNLMEEEEAKLGNRIVKRGDRYYSEERMPMETKPVENKLNGQSGTEPNQGLNEVFAGQEDDVSSNFLAGRQLAHEWNSPGLMAWRNQFTENLQPSQESESEAGMMAKAKLTPGPDQPTGEQEAVQDPYLDPTAAFSGGAGAMGKMSLSMGMKLMPSLGRAMLSGIVGGAADYPIGAVTEEVIEPEYPALALPFNVLTGMVSGATLETAIEKGVLKGLTQFGIEAKNAPELVKKLVKDSIARLSEGGRGQGSLMKSVVETLNEQFGKLKSEAGGGQLLPTVKGKELEPVLQDLMPTKEVVATAPNAKKILVSIGHKKPETEEKVERLFIPDLADLELKDKAININLNRIESADEIKRVIDRVSEIYGDEIQTARRGVRSNEQTERTANLMGMTPEELIARRKGQAFNAEQALSARRVLVSSAENVWGLAKKVQTIDATDADKFEFRKAVNLHYAIQAQVSGMTAEAGRALQSFNIQATSQADKTRQIKEFLGSMQSGVSIEHMAEAIATMDSAEGISKAIPKMLRATTKDMFLEAWINGLLSGPQTHVINTLSNSLNAVWQIPERFMASLIGRVMPGEQAIKEAEALHQAYGLIEGFKDGLKAGASALRNGVPSDEMSKIENSRYRSITSGNVRQLPAIKKLMPNALQEGGVAARAVDFMGDTIRIPGRFLMAEDEVFKSVGYRMELRAQAFRTAMQEGLKGDDAAKRMAQIMSDPEKFAPNVHLAAIDAARYQTFTSPLESRLLGALSSSKNPVIRTIVPFVRTPTNIMKYAFERTPFAFASSKIREDVMAGGARRDLALARVSMGSMLMATATVMAAEGMITGGGPSDSKLQANLRRQGWQPYSIKVGDKYVQYGRLEPLGMLFGMAADMSEISGLAGEELAPEIDSLASAIVMSIGKNVTSKTWLRGVSEAIEAMEDPDRYGNRYVQNYASSLIPTGVAQVERSINPEVEAVYSMTDALKKRIPGLSDSMPKRRDLWGEPVTTQVSRGERSWAETAFSAISPIYVSEGKDSPIDKELTRLKLGISMPSRKQEILGVSMELTPQMLDDYIVLMNKTDLGNGNLKQTLNELVSNPDYKRMGNEMKEEYIKKTFTKARLSAKAQLMEKYPILQDMAMRWKEKASAMQ